MMINIGQTIVLTDEEFQQEMAERREKLKLDRGADRRSGCPLCGYEQAASEHDRRTAASSR